MKKIILILLVIFSVSLSGCLIQDNGLYFEGLQYQIKSDNTIKIIRNTNKLATSVEVPDLIEDKIVNELGLLVFSECENLVSVTLPNTITKFGYGVFYNCFALTSINIPTDLEEIGQLAFYGCVSLASLDINHKLQRIGVEAFRGCAFTNIFLPISLTVIAYDAFYQCVNLNTIYYEGNQSEWDSVNKYDIPTNITIIYNYQIS